MFATVRRYALEVPSVDALAARGTDLGAVLASVPGFAACHLVRTRDGFVLVTLGFDEAALIESGRRFVAWADRHLVGFPPRSPADVWAGEVLLHADAAGAHTHHGRPADLAGMDPSIPAGGRRRGVDVSTEEEDPDA